MSLLSPKPIISQVHRTWSVSPGMTFALVEDEERVLWVEESCPAGTHFWSLEQATVLPLGDRTRPVVAEAVLEGRRIEQARQHQPVVTPEIISKAQPVRTTSRRLVRCEPMSTPPATKPRSSRAVTVDKSLVNA